MSGNNSECYSDPFSTVFWEEDFSKLTENGKVPFLLEKILPSDFSGLEEVSQAIRDFQDPYIREKVASRVRVYIDEDRYDDFALQTTTQRFLPNESLFEYMQRLTGVERFSLVVNNFEQLCKPLAADIGKFIQTMFSVRGIPIGGCEQVVFAGNYAGTAFGVHEGYEHAFLFHLGPGTKDFYCWSQEKYLELTNGNRAPTFGDYSWMLEHGQKFVLEPGNVLYLPASVYHVGMQTDFSISVAVPLYTYPAERFFSKIVLPGLSTFYPFDLEGMSEHIPVNYNENALSSFLHSTSNDFFQHSGKMKMDILLSYRWYRLLSNGGWELTSNYTSDPFDEIFLYEEMELKQQDTLRLIAPYKICWTRALNCSENELRVFLRAGSIIIPFQEEIIDLFSKLNNHEKIKLLDMRLLESFRALTKTGGLEIIN